MVQALWTVVAMHKNGDMTPLGTTCVSWAAAEDIRRAWLATYRCPVQIVRVGGVRRDDRS